MLSPYVLTFVHRLTTTGGFLVTFFCDRLKDNVSVQHVISGFLALVSVSSLRLTTGSPACKGQTQQAETVVRAMYQELHLQVGVS